MLSACPERHPGASHVAASLPPSFQFSVLDQRGFAKAHYRLEVEVKRPGRLHHNGLLEQSVAFLPRDPTLPPPMLSPATRRCEGLHSTLEATLPSPSILFIGSVVPLRLFVQRCATVGDDPPAIQSLSLTISIRTETTVTAGSHRNTWVSARELVRAPVVELPFVGHLSETPTEINNAPWKDTRLSGLTPSFTNYLHDSSAALAPGHGRI